MAPTRPVRTYSRRQSFKDSPASSSSKVDRRNTQEGEEVHQVERGTKRRAIAIDEQPSRKGSKPGSAAAFTRGTPPFENTSRAYSFDPIYWNHPLYLLPIQRIDSHTSNNNKGKNKAGNEHSLSRTPTIALERETTPGNENSPLPLSSYALRLLTNHHPSKSPVLVPIPTPTPAFQLHHQRTQRTYLICFKQSRLSENLDPRRRLNKP